MDILLKNGDHAVDINGSTLSITGTAETLQQALIRLSVKKGSFECQPDFGSELFRLSVLPTASRNRAALSYAREALSPMGNVEVSSAEVLRSLPDEIEVTINLFVNRRSYRLEVNEYGEL